MYQQFQVHGNLKSMDTVYCIKGTYECLHCIFCNNPSTLPHIYYLGL